MLRFLPAVCTESASLKRNKLLPAQAFRDLKSSHHFWPLDILGKDQWPPSSYRILRDLAKVFSKRKWNLSKVSREPTIVRLLSHLLSRCVFHILANCIVPCLLSLVPVHILVCPVPAVLSSTVSTHSSSSFKMDLVLPSASSIVLPKANHFFCLNSLFLCALFQVLCYPRVFPSRLWMPWGQSMDCIHSHFLSCVAQCLAQSQCLVRLCFWLF